MQRNQLSCTDFPKPVLRCCSSGLEHALNVLCSLTSPLLVYQLSGCVVQSVPVVFVLSTYGSYKAIHLFVPACSAGNED